MAAFDPLLPLGPSRRTSAVRRLPTIAASKSMTLIGQKRALEDHMINGRALSLHSGHAVSL
jgi:hypothetical protein